MSLGVINVCPFLYCICASLLYPLPRGCAGGRIGTKSVAISQHGTSVLFTSHTKDGLVVNLYIPHNQLTPLQAEEALGPISIPQGSRRVDPF
jgi:hypothetical protein